jgi:two-component system, OmpR family, phosphate regulon sensor histidine kinase PhoR
MNTSLNKIMGILALLFLLPVVFFTVSEISSVNENERVIEEIYSKQLETILFSINQYSEDVVNNWASSINLILGKGGNGAQKELESFLNDNASVHYMFLYKNEDFTAPVKVFRQDQEISESAIEANIKYFVLGHQDLIERLKAYKESGYRKIEPIAASPANAGLETTLLFILNDPFEGYYLCGIVIQSDLFIQQVLANKIESTAQERFYIAALREGTENPVYATDIETDGKNVQKKELWLLPSYYLTIVLKAKSIEELVKERSYSNLFLIIGVEVVLLLALWLVFKNIKREVSLAQQKSDFVSNVSHEIRTPLSLISMFAETLMLGRVKSEEKRQEYYTIISQEANRLAGIVNKILSFSRIESEKMKYDFQETNLNSVVNETLKDYQYHLKNNGFEYNFNTSDDTNLVKLDKEIVKEAIINLLDNAIKYSNGNKFIQVITGKEGKYAYVEVKDRGIGISKEDQKLVFDKFYRVSSGLVHNTKGTGLGLALVKQIMMAHHGNVTLESTPDKGSTFRLNFPLNKN